MTKEDWIYCGDGDNMPKEEGFYLCSLDKRVCPEDDLAVRKCWYSESHQSFTEYAGHIEAWMPLPKRYRKES